MPAKRVHTYLRNAFGDKLGPVRAALKSLGKSPRLDLTLEQSLCDVVGVFAIFCRIWFLCPPDPASKL